MVSGGASTAIEKRKSGKTLAKPMEEEGIKTSLEVVKAEIDAKETDARMVKISKDVTAIADKSMKGGLVLKDKAAQKERKAAERDKRAAQEQNWRNLINQRKRVVDFHLCYLIIRWYIWFYYKIFYGIVILKLIEFVPKLKELVL